MRLPYWVHRLRHRQRLSRSRLRGTWLHSRLGDRLLDKALWKPTHESLARAWLVGFPITMMPFLPIQSVFACIAAVFVRGNLLLCIALQFLSTPLTAPVHLPACYLVGEIVRGRSPAQVWHEVTVSTGEVFVGESLFSLYLGALVLGVIGGVIGYLAFKNLWSPRRPHTRASTRA
ncbi:MAG: DUF2062 domain-containing protein [Opitutaceae bacterium]|nr:DUF2062 domain-containing protein [Opitutaceae bacterium]